MRKWTVSPYNLSVRPSTEDYITPSEAGYSEEYIASAWHVIPGPARHRVKLYVSECLAESVCEVELHPTQENRGM